MILFFLLTGVVAVFIWRRHVAWSELLILTSWGLLAAGTTIGHDLSVPLTALSAWLSGLL